MVMPRSRSMSMESRYWARMRRGSTAPVISRMRSERVDLPWSMCAIIERLRILLESTVGEVATVTQGYRSTPDFPLGGVVLDPSASIDRPAQRVVAHEERGCFRGQYQEPNQAQQAERGRSRPQQGRQVRTTNPREERRRRRRHRG